MPLPKLENPVFVGKVPSTNQKFEFRPFLVKEQKNLLIAMESDDSDQIYAAFKNIVDSCITSIHGKKVNNGILDQMPSFDIEGIFLQISAKSVGESSTIITSCDHCGHENEVNVEVSSPVLKNFNKNSLTIPLTDTVGLKMKYPSLKDLFETEQNLDEESEIINVYKMILTSIESIYDEKSVYPVKDSTEEELTEFIESLSIQQMKKIEDFFTETPYLSVDASFTCSNCQKENTVEVKGIKNFFQ